MSVDHELTEKGRVIEAHLSERYGVDVFLTGSIALGIHIPGERDFDFVLPVSEDRIEVLRSELEADFIESSYDFDNADKYVFQGTVLGERVDLALLLEPVASRIRDALNRVREELSDRRRAKIISQKRRIKSSWILPRRRYHWYKSRLYRSLGVQRTKRRVRESIDTRCVAKTPPAPRGENECSLDEN